MKAVILNSGIGKRMGELTRKTPKGLVEIAEGETILGRQLNLLREKGIEDFLITTGPFADQFERYIKRKFPGLKVNYVSNPKYEQTNYIYTLYLAREEIKKNGSDILLLHGDLVFEPEIVEKVSNHQGNGVLVDSLKTLPEKDFKARIEEGYVTKVGVEFNSNQDCFLAPFYRLSADTMEVWLREIERFVDRGETKVYAENAFNQVSDKMKVEPIYFNGLFCQEIDNLEDLSGVKEYLKREQEMETRKVK